MNGTSITRAAGPAAVDVASSRPFCPAVRHPRGSIAALQRARAAHRGHLAARGRRRAQPSKWQGKLEQTFVLSKVTFGRFWPMPGDATSTGALAWRCGIDRGLLASDAASTG